MPMVRDDRNDQVYKTKDGKWAAVAKEIEMRHKAGQPVLVGTISVEVSELLSDQLTKKGIKHTRAEREARVRRARGRDDRRGGRAGGGHDRHQHGRPRRRHQARRQRRAPRLARGRKARPAARDARLRGALREGAAGDRGARRGPPRAGARRRRPVHPRHRAPRVAADRQPAARPLRPPGRPRRVALLPVRPGRPRAAVRRRADLQDPRPARARPTTRATRSRSRPGCSPSRSRRRRRRSRSSTS